MTQIAKVVPLYIRETHVHRELVCRVEVYIGSAPPKYRIMYFDAHITQNELEAEVAGATEADEIQVQSVFYLPVTREDNDGPF